MLYTTDGFLRANSITSLSDRVQQIATLLTTVNGNNKRLLLVAASIYIESCSWLVEILRGLSGFSVANSCRVDEIVPTLFALSASTLDSLLQRLIGGARKVVIEMFTHINKHSLDADFPARAVSLAKFERWSDHITTLRLKVPRTAFFYQLHQGAAAAADGDTFSAMSGTKEFKSALALLTTLPRCKAVQIQHDTPSSGWLLCDYQSSRREVRDKTMAVLGDVLRENLEHGLVGFMLSSHTQWYEEYRLCYFEEQEKEVEKETEEEDPRAEAEEDGRPAEVEEDGRRTELEEEGRGHEETEDAYAGQSRDMVRDEYRSRGLPRPIPKKKADIVAALQKDDLRRLE
ncbi:hypothetical protein J4E90_007469 [Alternaria incomplexa]|uniref:uncharacterized protein n=1 Tax=Alternaria incomplexa TaxID=1187928 RepID=UPI002220DC9E|nr:uncharacterized protein J4E90_007469 [Alternaria incomplexa]KAI4910039.1 hypothetical protein J4E90_007469 [Alternaria incomplexa]